MLERTIEIPVASDQQPEEVLALLLENDLPHTIISVSDNDSDENGTPILKIGDLWFPITQYKRHGVTGYTPPTAELALSTDHGPMNILITWPTEEAMAEDLSNLSRQVEQYNKPVTKLQANE